MPKISVIMPVFNGEGHLEEAVESILKQSFGDFEFIIINDGSYDGTSKILVSYRDRRIRLIERENRGFAHSLNEGIQAARGKYIARMDADDVALEDRFQLQYDFMESHPDVDILGGQAYVIDEKGALTGEMRKPVSWKNISQYIEYACPICHPTYFVRKRVYEITRGYRNMPPVEDYDFLLRAFEKRFIMENLSEKILKYRRKSSGMTTANPQRTVELTSMVQKLHRLRSRNKREKERILRILETYEKPMSPWFKVVFNARNKFLSVWKNQKGLKRYLFFLPIVVVSLGNYYLLSDSINGYRSLKWNV